MLFETKLLFTKPKKCLYEMYRTWNYCELSRSFFPCMFVLITNFVLMMVLCRIQSLLLYLTFHISDEEFKLHKYGTLWVFCLVRDVNKSRYGTKFDWDVDIQYYEKKTNVNSYHFFNNMFTHLKFIYSHCYFLLY